MVSAALFATGCSALSPAAAGGSTPGIIGLVSLGTMIFGMPALADSLASFALEIDRRGIEEHDIQIGEQIPALSEQRLLNEILVGAGSERRGAQARGAPASER